MVDVKSDNAQNPKIGSASVAQQTEPLLPIDILAEIGMLCSSNLHSTGLIRTRKSLRAAMRMQLSNSCHGSTRMNCGITS